MPGKKKKTPTKYDGPIMRAAASAADKAEHRLMECEELMLHELVSSRIQSILTKRWGCPRATVRKYMTAVRKRWKIEAELTGDRVARRDEMRELLRNCFATAMKRQKRVANMMGDAEVYDDPDLTASARILDMLCQLDGLYDKQEEQRITWLQQVIAAAPDTPEEMTALQDKLRLVEDGDPGKATG